MTVPLQVTFRDIDPSPAVEAAIEEHAAKLERFHSRIVVCHVTVEARHHHRHKGRLYNVRIDITVPGGEVLAVHGHPQDHAHEDVYIAVRDAFNAATRQLEDRVRKKGGNVKHHESPVHGKVARLFADYGFIDVAEYGDVYFHKNSVVDGKFGRLDVGSEVRLSIAENESEHGWQATTVHPVGKHRSNG